MVAKDKSFVFHVAGANAMPEAIKELNSSRIIIHGYMPNLFGLFSQVCSMRWCASVRQIGRFCRSASFGSSVAVTICRYACPWRLCAGVLASGQSKHCARIWRACCWHFYRAPWNARIKRHPRLSQAAPRFG